MIKDRTPDEKPESEQDLSSEAMHACMNDLISAIHDKDVKKALDAFKDLQECYPEESEEKPEPHSYLAQNQKAAD